MTFPPLWDAGADVMETTALWVLNPLYSFDDANPCPADWTEERIIEEYNKSDYKKADAIENGGF